MTSVPLVPPVPSAGLRLSAVPDQLDRYTSHMSGWNAELVDPGSAQQAVSTIWGLGSMVLTWNDIPARRVARSVLQVRADQIDHYQVHLPLAKSDLRLAVDGGREETLPAGEPVMVDLSRPYVIIQGAGPTIQAYVPRAVLDEMLRGPRDVHGKRLQGSAARLLADLMVSMTKGLPHMAAPEALGVSKSTMHLIAASLAASRGSLEQARPAGWIVATGVPIH